MFAQIIAICIFVTMFLLIILDKFERHYITLGSGALVLVLVAVSYLPALTIGVARLLGP